MTDIELYNAAKEAYYNGAPIMTDYEFDELEEKLGLTNKSYIGTKHNPSYTIKHPVIMGSLSKVQIKVNDEGIVPWSTYFEEIKKYIYSCRDDVSLIITPKYDGCSFELYGTQTADGQTIIKSISTRGDGEWGRDIKKHIEKKFNGIQFNFATDFILRGEVLVKKDVFASKYADFVNPRSFVSGVLNRDYDENDEELIEMCNDLSVVVYDARYCDDHAQWFEMDWTRLSGSCQDLLPKFFFDEIVLETVDDLTYFYKEFEEYRATCVYALDGIVFKPTDIFRVNNITHQRPEDCVAVKFIPMLEETEVVDIEWSTGKTNELRPVIIVKPVVMDGKEVTRASAHNYGYLINNKVSIGTKVILSLAGDIIPFIYKITDTTNYDETKLNIPECETYEDGVHLYRVLSDDEQRELKFIASAAAMNVPGIGPAAAKQIYDYMVEQCKGDEFFDIPATEVPNNLYLVSPIDVNKAIGGKAGVNAQKAYIEYLKNVRIADIIVSCTFEACGPKVAEQIEKQMLWGNGDFEHLASKAYQWALNDYTDTKFQQVHKIMEYLGINVEDYKIVAEKNVQNSGDLIPVILTGEPNDYKSKGDFMNQHPEYRLTGSWKEVKIVFTNDMSSKTGKMKKALEKGIEIRLY